MKKIVFFKKLETQQSADVIWLFYLLCESTIILEIWN